MFIRLTHLHPMKQVGMVTGLTIPSIQSSHPILIRFSIVIPHPFFHLSISLSILISFIHLSFFISVMASPNLYPTPKGEPDLTRDYDGVPSLHHEVCHLLGSNPDSDDEEPPPAYHGLFGDEGDVHAYGPIDGHFTVEYHRHPSQVNQTSFNKLSTQAAQF